MSLPACQAWMFTHFALQSLIAGMADTFVSDCKNTGRRCRADRAALPGPERQEIRASCVAAATDRCLTSPRWRIRQNLGVSVLELAASRCCRYRAPVFP
jgi:hypothetical protein